MALGPDVEGLLLRQADVSASQAHSAFKPAELSTPGRMMSSATNRITLWLKSSLGVINHWIPFIGTTGSQFWPWSGGLPTSGTPPGLSHFIALVGAVWRLKPSQSLSSIGRSSNPKEVGAIDSWCYPRPHMLQLLHWIDLGRNWSRPPWKEGTSWGS